MIHALPFLALLIFLLYSSISFQWKPFIGNHSLETYQTYHLLSESSRLVIICNLKVCNKKHSPIGR